MKNKNFVPTDFIESILYEGNTSYHRMRERLNEQVFKDKPFLQYKFDDICDIVNMSKFQSPNHNIKRYAVGEIYNSGYINGCKIPSSRAHYYLFSMYLASLLGIEKKPTGNEDFETIKNGMFLLMLEFDITSILKYQELMLKLTTGVLTGQGPLVAKKEKTVKKDIRGGISNE